MKKMETEHGDSVMVSEEMDGSLFDPDSMVEEPEGQEESRLHGKKEDWRDGIKLSHFRSDSLELDVVEHYRCSVEPNFATKEPVVAVEFDMHKNEASELFNVLVHKPDGIDTVNLKSAESVLEVVSVKRLDVEDCYKVRGYRRFVRLTFTASSNM